MKMNKCCATCPFLEANRGKPTPTDSNMGDQSMTDWYSQHNLNGVWKVVQQVPVAFMSCHSTDPDYYGRGDGSDTTACVGLTFQILMHLFIFKAVGQRYQHYVGMVGMDLALPEDTLMVKAALMKGGYTPFETGLHIPMEFKNIDINKLRFPTGSESVFSAFKHIMNSPEMKAELYVK